MFFQQVYQALWEPWVATEKRGFLDSFFLGNIPTLQIVLEIWKPAKSVAATDHDLV